MPRFLLDTNIASFIMKQSHPALERHLTSVRKEDLGISALTEAEIRFGLALLPPGAGMHRVAERFLQQIEIVPWDSRCASSYASLAVTQKRQGNPLSAMDTLIAAHSLALGATLVTNDKDFRFVRALNTEDWTKVPRHL